MLSSRSHFRNFIFLGVFSFFAFFIGNNVLPLTDPDEVFYTQTAKEMIQRRTWTVPYLFGEAQFEKPILTYWCLRVGFRIFGVTPFGARFFPAFFAMAGVWAVYALAFWMSRDSRRAMLSAVILMSTGIYAGLARTVFTDMIFSVFILLALAAFYAGYVRRERLRSSLLLFYIFCALAVLTKGPLGFFVPFLTVFVFLAVRRELRVIRHPASIAGFFIFLIVGAPWYIDMIQRYGDGFIQEFFYNDHIRRLREAEHVGDDRWYFYPLSSVGAMFPWTVFSAAALGALAWRWKKLRDNDADLFLASWIGIVFVVFQAAHSKLVSYIIPFFPAVAILTGNFIIGVIDAKKEKVVFGIGLVTGLLLLTIPVGLFVGMTKFPQYVSSKFSVAGFIALLVVILAAMLTALRRCRFGVYFGLLAAQIFLLLFFSLACHRDYEDRVSVEASVALLPKEPAVGRRILCSKALARGVHFYTDQPVAVIDIAGKGYFSPHPIPFLNTDEKVKASLRGQGTTYAVLTHSAFDDLSRIVKTEQTFKMDILGAKGDKSVVKVLVP